MRTGKHLGSSVVTHGQQRPAGQGAVSKVPVEELFHPRNLSRMVNIDYTLSPSTNSDLASQLTPILSATPSARAITFCSSRASSRAPGVSSAWHSVQSLTHAS